MQLLLPCSQLSLALPSLADGWYLARQSADNDENHDEKDVELRVSGEFAKLTDGEKPSKGSGAIKDKQRDAKRSSRGETAAEAKADEAGKAGAARARDGQDADAAAAEETTKYEYGYVEFGHAGAGRKRVQAAQESLADQLTPLARKLISFSMQLADLAQRIEICERSRDVASTDVASTRDVASRALRCHLEKVIDHLALMLDSETQQLKESAATTLGVMVRGDTAFKGRIAADKRIIAGLTKLMNEGVLEAISAVECLLASSEEACNQARDAGAIGVLAGFINTDDGDGGMEGGSVDVENEEDDGDGQRSKRKGPPPVLQPGVYDLADLDADMLEQAFVMMGMG